MDWDDLEILLAVSRAQSFSEAARRLGLTKATVQRRVGVMAAQFGSEIASIGPHRDRAPPIGPSTRLLTSMERVAEGGARGVAAGRSAGAVRVSTAELVGLEILPAVLGPLLRRHRDLAVTMSIQDGFEDLLRGEADIAVRLSRPLQQALLAKAVGRLRLGLYAHKDYLAAHGEPRAVADLRRFGLIGANRDSPSMDFLATLGLARETEPFALLANSDAGQLAALRAGIGVGVHIASVACREPDLTAVLPDITYEAPVWIAMHEDVRGTRRMRLVFDALAGIFTAQARDEDGAAALSPGG